MSTTRFPWIVTILCLLLTNAAVFAATTTAATQPVAADDDTVFCNHAPLKNAPPPADVRCENAATTGRILLFARGTKPLIELPIQNDRAEAIAADYVLALVDRQGVQLRQQAGQITLAAGVTTAVSYTLDTSDLKFGVYSVMLRVAAAGKPLTDREYYVGVISDTKIPKSGDGQFLYGLDPNYGPVLLRPPVWPVGKRVQPGQCSLLEWFDAMGVDILRCAGCELELTHLLHPERLNWITDDLPKLHQQGLRVMGMAGPPFPDKATNSFLPKDMAKWTALVEDTARKTPDITYWELGNEPDLGYPGMDKYVEIYEETYKAIKRGNPNALVMNAGITFFGAKGPGNSHRFFELVNPACIDVFAYHAHGPGSGAERRVYELSHAAAVEFNKADKPLADTESGMFVGSKKQEDMQAWMVVQKQTYAQSVGLKFLMTFRLHAFRSERGWGLLRSDQEPQPAILAYRTMTEHLKGLAYQSTLALGKTYAEGYAFAQANGPQRACVLWANQPAFYNIYLKVAAAAAQAKNLRLMDLYGNTSPADVSTDGVVRMEVTQAPAYLLWDAADPKLQIAVTHSMLQTPDMVTVVPNATTPLDIGITNSSDADLTATLSATIAAPGQAAITPDKQTLTIPAKHTLPVHLAVQWNTEQLGGLVWPTAWLAYTDVKETDVNLAELREAPVSIKGLAGRPLQAVSGSIGLLRPGEVPREKRPGFVFGAIQSDREQTVRMGCAADFWMECRLNGQVVCSTMQTGNGSSGVTERIVDLPLKKGANLLAFKILSGKGGWGLTLASPADLPALLDPRKASNCIELSLESNGQLLARDRLALQPVRRIAPLGDGKWTDSKDQWTAVNPDFALDNTSVTNLFDKQQDRSKWWQGMNDLSATAWLRADDKRLYLMVWVLDDKDVTGTDPASLWQFDSLQVGLAKEAKAPSADAKPAYNLYSIGRINGKVVIYKENASQGLAKGVVDGAAVEISAQVERTGAGTFYRVALDRVVVGDGVFRLNFLVNDNDDGYRKQYIELTHGLGSSQDPALWGQFILPAAK